MSDNKSSASGITDQRRGALQAMGWPSRIALVLLSIIIGFGAVAIFWSAVRMVLPDPADQCARNYIATHEFRISDKPMPQGLAQIIAKQCWEGIERESIRRRFEATHGWLTVFAITTVAMLFDPLNLVMGIVFSALAGWIALRLFGRGAG